MHPLSLSFPHLSLWCSGRAHFWSLDRRRNQQEQSSAPESQAEAVATSFRPSSDQSSAIPGETCYSQFNSPPLDNVVAIHSDNNTGASHVLSGNVTISVHQMSVPLENKHASAEEAVVTTASAGNAFSAQTARSSLHATGSCSGSGSSSGTSFEYRCPVCMENVSNISLVIADTCGHGVCGPCMLQYLVVASRERRWPVPCIDCGRPLAPEQCLHTLQGTTPEFDMMERVVLERCFHGETIRYCANNECRAPFEFVSRATHSFRSQISDEVACPLCHAKTCIKCNQFAHENLTCELAAGCSQEVQDNWQLARLARRKGWRPCPQCKTFTEKDVGCNYCVCVCGATFCFKCGLPYKSRHRYGLNANVHGVPNCSCGLYT